MWFRNLRFITKLIIGFGIVLLMMASVNIFSILKMATLKTEFDDLAYSWLPRAIAISEIHLNTTKLRLNQLQHAITENPDSKQEQTAIMIELIDLIDERRDLYEALWEISKNKQSITKEEELLYKDFNSEWESYQDISFEFFMLIRENNTQKAVELLNNQGEEAFATFGKDLQMLVNIFTNDAERAGVRAETTFMAMRRITSTILILTIIISIIFAAVLVRLIMIPLRKLEDAAQEVILGNLDVKLDTKGKDEIGILARTFNRMTRSLKAATDELKETNEQLEIKSISLEKQKRETDQKNVELNTTMNQLKSTQSQLIDAEKMASLGQLTAGIAHEINNPINFVYSSINPLTTDIEDLKTIVDSCKTIRNHPQAEKILADLKNFPAESDLDYLFEEIYSLLGGIKEGAERTSEIVAGLRNFSRLDENAIKPIQIHEGLDATLMLLQNKLKAKAEIVKDYGNLPDVECYPGKINQVFMNILNNAIQALDTSGTISIKTWQEKEFVCISIKDDGKGMDDSIRSRIFEPFFTTKDVGKGTGLGLSISYGIIENHNGRIVVKSELGKGAEFVIYLPVTFSYQEQN